MSIINLSITRISECSILKNMEKEIKFFIIHYKKLVERKKNLLSYLQRNSFKFEFIEEINRNTLTKENRSNFTEKKDDIHKAIFLSHIDAFKKVKESHYGYNLILEDDSIPHEDFYKRYSKYLDQLPDNFDMFFISPGKNNFHLPWYKRIPFKKVYKKDNIETHWGGHGASRCADAYFISKKCATTLHQEFLNKSKRVDTSIDWWMNQMIDKYNLKIYWAEPTFVDTNLYETSFNVD